MKKIITILSIFLLFGSTALQCDNHQDCCELPPCSEKATLSGTWRLTAFRNVETGAMDNDPDPEGKGVVFTFTDDEKEGSIEGHTFVNTVFGAYTLTSGCSMSLNPSEDQKWESLDGVAKPGLRLARGLTVCSRIK